MKQSTSFGTAYAEGMVQQDVLLAQDSINYTLKKKGEKLNVDFENDSTTAVTSADRKGDYTEDDDDVYSPNESDAYDNDSIEEEIDSWLNYIRTDIKSLAKTIRSTAGGVAHFVHRSAVTVVNEIKSLDNMDYDDDVVVHDDDVDVEIDERNVNDVTSDDIVDGKHVNGDDIDAGMNSEVKNNANTNVNFDMYPFCESMKSSTKLLLPWELEITDQDKRSTSSSPYFNDVTLKQRILQISQAEENFELQNHSHNDTNVTFDDFSLAFDSDTSPVCDLIKELLMHDTHLLRVHTKHKFSANVAAETMMSDDEKKFWYNYFYACTMVRNQYICEKASVTTSKVVDMDISIKTNISREDAEPMIGTTTTGTMMSHDSMNEDDDAAVPLTTEMDDTRSKNDDDDEDDNSYICLSESDDRNSTTNIPNAPYSSGMKSIDSMVFVEDVSPSSDSSTITTTTNTKNISTNFFRFFA